MRMVVAVVLLQISSVVSQDTEMNPQRVEYTSFVGKTTTKNQPSLLTLYEGTIPTKRHYFIYWKKFFHKKIKSLKTFNHSAHLTTLVEKKALAYKHGH